MRIFGLEITRSVAKAFNSSQLSTVADSRGGWWPVIHEPFSGAWQQNIIIDQTTVLSHYVLWACLSLVSGDISKLRIKLVQQDKATGIWIETTNPAYDPVLREPNGFQTQQQFVEGWILSKLLCGNTYVLIERDRRGVVNGLTVLDPKRVMPMVADDGSVFYQLQSDNLSGLRQAVLVPASEIIHDRYNCLWHPLVGVSPLFAAQLPAWQGLKIQESSTTFFANKSMPGGILTAPGHIQDDTADRLKTHWDTNYTGDNAGKVAVLGDGLEFKAITASAEASQMVEQSKTSGEAVCACFHVPLYKVGLGPMPTNNNVQALNMEYYQQALQTLIEGFEGCLDRGLGIGWAAGIGTELDIENLLRMDTLAQADVVVKLAGGGLMKIDEGRSKFGMLPIEGGDAAYLQQQNYSLPALAKRDASDDPFASSGNSGASSVGSSSSAPAKAAAKEVDNVSARASSFRLAVATAARRSYGRNSRGRTG
jgi:HK97 family phage portal protein